MVLLLLLWLCIGALVGLLATAADLRPASWQPHGWLRMAGLGAGVAFGGGWLGILLLGRPFATILALSLSVAGVVCISWITSWLTKRMQKRSYI
ncbi:MAG: hypothetical protein NVS2B12_24960 [Ktedonobacteraceae bacterium]